MNRCLLICILLSVGAKTTTGQSNPMLDDYLAETISPFSADYEMLKGNLIQYRPGDVILGAMVRVHGRGAGDVCSEILEDGIQALETINMIVDQVNGNDSLLPGLTLGTLMIDTCDIDTHALQRALNAFLPYFFNTGESSFSSSFNQSPLFVGAVGAASSAVSIQTASLLQIFKIPQVSPWSTHPSLSDKNRFPYFFRTVPSDAYQAIAMLSLIAEKNWNYFSVVYEDDFYGVRGYREVELIAEQRGICVATARAINRNPTDEDFTNVILELLKFERAKAVIVFTKRNDAEKLIQAAHANPESRDHFFWIGSDGWSGQIPSGENSDYVRTLDGALAFNPKRSVIPSLKPYMENIKLEDRLVRFNSSELTNPWYPEYLSKVLNCSLTNSTEQRQCTDNDKLNPATFFTLSKMQSVADAALAFIHSFHRYRNRLCPNVTGVCEGLRNMAGTNQVASEVAEIMKTIVYRGVNGGSLKFDANQDGPAVYDVQTFNNQLTTNDSVLRKWSLAGTYENNVITWENSYVIRDDVTSVCSEPCKFSEARKIGNDLCCWQCLPCLNNQYVGNNGTECVSCDLGEKPDERRSGCVAFTIEHSRYSDVYSVVPMCLGVVGICMALFVTAVYVVNRSTPMVKASGKELCVIILLGALFCFFNSFVLASPAQQHTCAISRLLICLGPTLMYSGLLTKTIRVVIIFRSKRFLSSSVKTFLLPKFQILTALTFVLIQTFVVVIWFVVSTPTPIILYPNPDTAFRTCIELGKTPRVFVGLVYPFLLIITCTVLASVNRNIPTGFRETQYIGFTMYATCVIWLAFVPIFVTNSSNIPLKVATLSICLSLSAMTVLFCLFGTRCYAILFKPLSNTKENVMSSTNGGSGQSSGPDQYM